MGIFGDTFLSDLLKLIVNGTPIANLADNASSSPLANLFVALHTAYPDVDQTSNELTYSPYARLNPARSSVGFTVVGNFFVPNADITFAKPVSGAGQLATYGSIGFLASGAGKIMFRAPLNPPVSITTSNAPIIVRGSKFEID